MSKRVVRWKCEHATDGKACVSNDACQQTRRREKIASAKAAEAELEQDCTVKPVAAAFVALCVATVLYHERPPAVFTPVKAGRQQSLFESFLTRPAKAPSVTRIIHLSMLPERGMGCHNMWILLQHWSHVCPPALALAQAVAQAPAPVGTLSLEHSFHYLCATPSFCCVCRCGVRARDCLGAGQGTDCWGSVGEVFQIA